MLALIIDPALHTVGGHHFTASMRLRSELRALGIRCLTLISRRADSTVKGILSAKACLTWCLYARVDWTEEEFDRFCKKTFREIEASTRWLWEKPCVVVLPTCDSVLAEGLARCLERWPRHKRPAIVLWLLFRPHTDLPWEHPASDKSIQELRAALSHLASVARSGAISLFCETPEMAQVYSRALGFPAEVAIGPGIAAGPIRKKKHGTSPIVIGTAGHAHTGKGFELLPEVVKQVLGERANVRFHLHAMHPPSDVQQTAIDLDKALPSDDRVLVCTSVLSESAFVDWLRRLDLLLMPYDPRVYADRGSGLFADASKLGLPTIVTGGCGFASSAFIEGRAVPIDHYTSASVSVAISKAISILPALSARAAEHAEELAERNELRLLLQAALTEIQQPA